MLELVRYHRVEKQRTASKYVVNTVDYTRPFESQASTAEIVNSIYSLYRESMELMQSQLDITELERMADGMFRANRIFLYGIGDVKTILQTFMNMLLKIGCFPVLATDNGGGRAYFNLHYKGRLCAVCNIQRQLCPLSVLHKNIEEESRADSAFNGQSKERFI